MREWLLTKEEVREALNWPTTLNEENYNSFRAVARAQAEKLVRLLSDQAVFVGGSLFRVEDWQALREELGLDIEPIEGG